MPHDKHNNPALITIDDLKEAARAAGLSPEDAAANIASALGLDCKKD